MTKLEKVIKALDICLTKGYCDEYTDCPYMEGSYCQKGKILHDALELLKEQKQILVHSSKYHGIMYAECPKCHERIDSLVNKHFCGNCGQAIKWIEWIETAEGR